MIHSKDLKRRLSSVVDWLLQLFQTVKKTVEITTVETKNKITEAMSKDYKFPHGETNWDMPNNRGPLKDVRFIIIHSLSEGIKTEDGNVHGIEFVNSLGLSYHRCVRQDGHVYNCLPYDLIGLHAGKSKAICPETDQIYTDLNKHSIGLSLLVPIDGDGYGDYGDLLRLMREPDTYTDLHYKSLAWECHKIMNEFPKVTLNHILGHDYVSGSDVRPDPKRDPGKGFDWDRLKKEIWVHKTGTI